MVANARERLPSSGLFITFEGPEGSGKTTQARLLSDWLRQGGNDVLATREPGGSRISDAIRGVLLDPQRTDMLPATEILLFSAARAQLVGQVIKPHLARAGIVVCDRYADSTLAYQGFGRGLDLEQLRMITEFATGGLTPNLTICLDLPALDGLGRKMACDAVEWNRMEQEQLAFHERVRQGYLALSQREPARWMVLDAKRPIDELQTDIRVRVESLLNAIEGCGRG